jgi:hypothetical protein
MAKSKSGLTLQQRDKMLHRLGFELTRQGKGSHMSWEHTKLRERAESGAKLPTPPANLRSGLALKPWEVTVPGDPATGTWRSIIKYAEWCDAAAKNKLSASFNSFSADARGVTTTPDPAPHRQHGGKRHSKKVSYS